MHIVDDRRRLSLVLQLTHRIEFHCQQEEQEEKSHVSWYAPWRVLWSQLQTHDVGVLEDVLPNHQYVVTAL